MAVLNSRLTRDTEKITQALHAYGYYDGTVSGQVTEGNPARVSITVKQGPLYGIGSYRIVWQGAAPDIKTDDIPAVGLPASGKNIISAGDRLTAMMKDAGYYDGKIIERQVVLNRASGKVDVTVTANSGGLSTSGSIL